MGRTYSKVATGGTFDRIHAGHRRLLERSFEVGDEVVIGLTSDEFARREGKRPKRSYRQRAAGLDAYLRRNFPGRRYAIARLDDYFGPGIANAEVEALVASPETGKRVELANGLRAERGFSPLELVVIDWVPAEDGQPISSTRIRRGDIDEEGRLLSSAPAASKATAGEMKMKKRTTKEKEKKEKKKEKEEDERTKSGSTATPGRDDEKSVSHGGEPRRRRRTGGT